MGNFAFQKIDWEIQIQKQTYIHKSSKPENYKARRHLVIIYALTFKPSQKTRQIPTFKVRVTTKLKSHFSPNPHLACHRQRATLKIDLALTTRNITSTHQKKKAGTADPRPKVMPYHPCATLQTRAHHRFASNTPDGGGPFWPTIF